MLGDWDDQLERAGRIAIVFCAIVLAVPALALVAFGVFVAAAAAPELMLFIGLSLILAVCAVRACAPR